MLKTPYHQWHIVNGAKMGEFAGYDMPLFYKLGVLKEHQWVRSGHAGVFDVSHMGQVILQGKGVAEFLEHLTPSTFQTKKNGQAQYTVLMNEQGGMVDDLIVTRLGDEKFFVVLNAGCKDKDIAWIKSHLPAGIQLYHMKDQALIALQGGWAERILYEVFEFDAHEMPYMSLIETQAKDGTPIMISRLGYTGEDGFEISLPSHLALEMWQDMCGHSEAEPIGLAARDSLRLDMAYPLYGHDIDDTTSPIEAGIKWIIRKENLDCIGSARLKNELQNGVKRKRVGLKLLDKGIAREGSEILNEAGEKIGTLSSGGFSPSLDCAVGMGYVPPDVQIGDKVQINVRGRNIAAKIVKMPFMTAKTKK